MRWRSKEASLMTQRPNADDLMRLWDLSVMPTEKVYFAQSYVDEKTGADGKPLCSAIVALVTDDPSTFSDMHRLPTDEIWHFYLGDPIELLLLHRDGRDELVVLGHEVLAGQEVQRVVPAGTWMGPGCARAASTASTATRWRPGSFSVTSRALRRQT
jgi:hypothetical protein